MTKKTILTCLLTLLAALLLSGCGPVGSKTGSITVIYGTATVFSLLMPVVYCAWVRRRSPWVLLLLASVLVVNAGYFALSLSGTVEEALLANRIAYLGSVFLPMSMLMIILSITRLKHPRWLPVALLAVSIVIFLIAASPGYLDIYYKSVSLIHVNGVAILQKEYGPWHCSYLFYLLAYFAVIIAVVIHANIKKKLDSKTHAAILTFAVFVNIGVWLLEQLVQMDFELLSVSYIITEFFLISLYMILQERETPPQPLPAYEETPEKPLSEADAEDLPALASEMMARCLQFEARLPQLTPTEHAIYHLYADGKSTAQVLEAMNIKENTLKFHNKNIYGKLEVSSRKELLELAHELHHLHHAPEP